MKRAKLIDRAGFLFELQEGVARAAREFIKHEDASTPTTWQRELARKQLHNAALSLGLAMKRYLGGRER